MKRLTRAAACGLTVTLVLLSGIMLFSCTSPSTSGRATATPTPANTQTSPTLQPEPEKANHVEVVYFHRTKRCYSCQYAGDMTQYTLENYFSSELVNGKLVFKMLDLQDGANAEIVKEYGAFGSSLYVNTVTEETNHIQHVAEIWYHVGDDEKFVNVVKDAIVQQLESI